MAVAWMKTPRITTPQLTTSSRITALRMRPLRRIPLQWYFLSWASKDGCSTQSSRPYAQRTERNCKEFGFDLLCNQQEDIDLLKRLRIAIELYNEVLSGDFTYSTTCLIFQLAAQIVLVFPSLSSPDDGTEKPPAPNSPPPPQKRPRPKQLAPRYNDI